MARVWSSPASGGVSALGYDWPDHRAGLRARRNDDSLHARLGSRTRTSTRTWRHRSTIFRRRHTGHANNCAAWGGSRSLAVRAAELAVADAGLTGNPVGLPDGRWAWPVARRRVAPRTSRTFAAMMLSSGSTPRGLNANSYVRMMPHTTAANIGIFFGADGPDHSHLERLHFGQSRHRLRLRIDQASADKTAMLAGGAEELCPSEAMAFDMLFATSRRNEEPHTTPRPYDADRDGLVVGEGCGHLVLEELEHAQRARRAHPGRGGRLRQQLRRRACDASRKSRPCAR